MRFEQASRALGGPIDILVNNAGSTPEDGIDRLDFAKWQYSVALKQFGYARFAQLVLPAMRAQKWGRIVNVIGRSGHQPRPVYLAGGSVNAGLLSFTKALAEECARDNVLVTGVNPGPIDTPRWRSLREAAVRTRGGDRRSVRWPRDRQRTARPYRYFRGGRRGGAVSLFRARKFRDRRDHQCRRRRHALHIERFLFGSIRGAGKRRSRQCQCGARRAAAVCLPPVLRRATTRTITRTSGCRAGVVARPTIRRK